MKILNRIERIYKNLVIRRVLKAKSVTILTNLRPTNTSKSLNEYMSIWRVIISIFCPPLAVIDKGCGSFVITFLLWLCGWVPGVIAALVILNNPDR